MTEADLLKRINATETKLGLWKSIHSSPGYFHQIELLNLLKAHEQFKDMFCTFVKWDRRKLDEMLVTLDTELLLGDQIAADADADTSLLDKLKAHDKVLWGIAKLLG